MELTYKPDGWCVAAECRIGDKHLPSPTQEKELNLHTPWYSIQTEAQHTWPGSGVAWPWSITWDQTTGRVTFTADGQTLVYDSCCPDGRIWWVGFWLSAYTQPGSAVNLFDMEVTTDGGATWKPYPLGDVGKAFGDPVMSFYICPGYDRTFTIRGSARWTWDAASLPTRSQLNWSVYLWCTDCQPDPYF
jgi:hypothetical protein